MVISILLTVVILWEDKENLMGSITGLDLIYTELSEGFISYLELCISFGLIINVPYIMLTIYQYNVEGLYSYEEYKVRKYMISLLLLFYIVVYCYIIIILPYMINFFSTFDNSHLTMSIKIGDITSIISKLFISSIITLLLPILGWKYNIGRKYVILLILVMSAIITPPDVFSLIMLGFPLIIFYEVSIFIGKLIKD